MQDAMTETVTLLKADELGRIERVDRGGVLLIRRDISSARWWARAFARRAAARAARALCRLAGIDGVPRLPARNGRLLERQVRSAAGWERG